MKKDYEEYRDTGVLGSYHPEMAVLREQRGGEVLTTFRDTNYQQQEDHLESQREMLIRGKVFHVTSVFPIRGHSDAHGQTALHDRRGAFRSRATAPDVLVDLGEPVGYCPYPIPACPWKRRLQNMASQKYNILYGRLSQEDERQGEVQLHP